MLTSINRILMLILLGLGFFTLEPLIQSLQHLAVFDSKTSSQTINETFVPCSTENDSKSAYILNSIIDPECIRPESNNSKSDSKESKQSKAKTAPTSNLAKEKELSKQELQILKVQDHMDQVLDKMANEQASKSDSK